jgi:hypothetical protein
VRREERREPPLVITTPRSIPPLHSTPHRRHAAPTTPTPFPDLTVTYTMPDFVQAILMHAPPSALAQLDAAAIPGLLGPSAAAATRRPPFAFLHSLHNFYSLGTWRVRVRYFLHF